MKNSRLKFACIFIIVIFCLAPLSAVDLNQDDNNNKYINQNDNEMDMAVEDANIHINDDESEATGNDESKSNPNLGINVDDITVVERATVDITANETLNGQVYVKVDGSSSETPVMVKDGHGQVTLNDALEAGTHTASVRYDGDSIFMADEKSTTFEVKRITPKMSVSVNDIEIGESPIINLQTSFKEPTLVTIHLSKDHKLVAAHEVIVNNTQTIQMHEKIVDAGTYEIRVSFDRNKTHEFAEATTYFNVYQKVPVDPNLRISSKNIYQGQAEIITVTTDAKFSGKVFVNVADKNYVVKVTNGKGTLKVLGLNVGKYTANATLRQNAFFNGSTKFTRFEVKE